MRSTASFIWKCSAYSWGLILLILLLVSTLSNESAFCQEQYFKLYPTWSSGVGERTHSVALGDVDGDGDLDLVCGNYQYNTLYSNTGGSFVNRPSQSLGVGGDTQSIALGDVDNDGDLDLVCGNDDGRSTVLFLNHDGTFDVSPAWSSVLIQTTRSVALGDVDGDGDLDLVCGNYGQGNALYLNTGGTFETSPSWSSGLIRNTESIALGDVDGDGDLDLVCGNYGQGNTRYLNTGDTFEIVPSWSSELSHNTKSVALGDVDGDGDLDLVCGNYGQGDTFCKNIGGTFQSLPTWSSGPTENTESVVLGDVDGDGDLDLMCGNYQQSKTLYLNTGNTFQTSPAWSSGLAEVTESIALGDVDGDGDLDLVCGNSGVSVSGQDNSFYSNTSGSFAAAPTRSWGPSQDAGSIALGDVDGDGDLDVACGSGLYLSEEGILATVPAWSSASGSDNPALGDVDGDGDLDLVCSSGNYNRLYLNTGGTFGASPSWTSGLRESTWSMALGDVDGDGDLDLACGNSAMTGECNTLYLNLGGTFETAPSWSSGPAEDTRSIALGDIDGDGDLDLVCGNMGLNYFVNLTTSLYLNTGGTFETAPSWSSEHWEGTESIVLGDVDGDGDLDLVCGNIAGSNSLFLNDGGIFDTMPAWLSEPHEHTVSIALGDVEGDGDLDLVCGNAGQSNTRYLNTGGTFETLPSWSSGLVETTESIALGDVEGDGDLDIVCGNSSPPSTLYAGKAQPAFRGDLLSPNNHLPNNSAHLRFVAARIASPPEYYRVDFTARDVESDPIWLVPEYRYEGDATWHPAVIGGQTGRVGPFLTSPAGIRDSIDWDTRLFPFDQRTVVLRLRVIEMPRRVSIIQHIATYLKEIEKITPYRPVISAAAPLVFPAVTLGDTTLADLPIANYGTAPLTITDVELPSADMHLVDEPPILVPPNESAELTIMLAPSGDADIQGNLIIQSNDPFSPSTAVELDAHVRPLDFTLVNLYPTGEIAQNTPLGISVVMQNYVHVDSANVFYREGGRASFDVLRLQRLDDTVNEQYYGSIPASAVAARGIEYCIKVYNERFSREGSLRRLRTRVKNMDFAATPEHERYGMLSIPLEMEGPIFGVLSDDLGGLDETKWRMWGYDVTAAAYVELPDETTTDFEVGRGYWLITREGRAIDTGPAEGLSTPTDGAFEIVLRPGWSMLGNPFAFPVEWSAIEVDTFSMTEALEQGMVEPLWRWEPSAGQYAQDVASLEPFEAYWVMNAADPPREIVLRVPPVEAGAGAELPSPNSPGDMDDSGAWEIAVRVMCGDTGTGHNIIGVRPRSLEEYDSFDRSEPPMSPGEGISLYFPHMKWERHPGRYATDMRAPGVEPGGDTSTPRRSGTEGCWGRAWLFDIAKTFSEGAAGDEIMLKFSGLDSLPGDFKAILVDRTLERVVDIRKENQYLFYQGARAYVARDEDARFELVIGSGAFVDAYGDGLPALPTETVLHQNHPNPFNPSTVIRYELAKAGRAQLKIYDVSGALVKVLEDRDREPGRYEAGWDGTNERDEQVASGVYFYVLEAPETRLAKKMLCVK